jgi:basic amino acid/polyamine antiporter, APA family
LKISSPCFFRLLLHFVLFVRLFILVGLVSHSYAGPAAVLSWTVAGVAALLSAVCYAELSARIPVAGGAYAYVSTAIGELPAVITATCLSMNYIGASGAVARSWGDKLVAWVAEELGDTDHWLYRLIRPRGPFSPLACAVSSAAVLLLLIGVKESKMATNIFTTLKVCVSIFMVVGGLYFVDTTNWTPFVPPEFGVSGVMRGATATFFGYLGYDCVCSLGGEAIQPERNLPISILFTLISVLALYVTATLALTGMQPYEEISPVSGFSSAFYANDAKVAGEIVAIGELATLPIVVLIAIMAEPRLMLALAEDRILPRYFRHIDAAGNLSNGTLVAGSVMIVVSTLVPFEKLNDMISFAVLTILNLTDSSLILLWHESPTHSRLAGSFLLGYHGCALATALLLTYFYNNALGQSLIILFAVSTAAVAILLHQWCPRSAVFGGLGGGPSRGSSLPDATEDRFFRTPFVPFWPCLAIFTNWYLIVQLEVAGILAMLGILAGTTLLYVISGKRGDDPAEESGDDHHQDHSSSSEFGGSVEL